jgi:two-component system CheB/CheR fusion protein
MLVQEELARQELQLRVQIFAGDIDEPSLETARLGRYPEGIARYLTPERLERFFHHENGCYVVAKSLREMCVFSSHSLIKDPPFSRIDLLVCRNLLIYLEADVQRQVATLFHYSLRSGGYLFLGPSESLLAPPDLFRTVDKRHRIFERKESVARPALSLPAAADAKPARAGRPWIPRVAAPGQREIVSRLERLLLDSFAPAWVVVNAQCESVYFSPRTGRYLEAPAGHPSMDVVSMARKSLRIDLRTALHKAVRTGEMVTHEGIEVPTEGETQHVNLIVRPLGDIEENPGLYLIVFQEVGRAVRPAAPGRTDEDDQVALLESELRMTKEHLQATVEEVETSNEELKSSNEELLSTNEELQSANEELQTSKEELQSVNEELETINAELTQKLEELDLVNSDLQNLLQNTQIPTLFLDDELRIKRFTDAATAVFRLIPTDAGRPITDIAQRFDGEIVADLTEVLHTRIPCERRVRLTDGSATYIMRTLPYRRVDRVQDGLVVAFLDVTQLEAALERSARLAAIVESSQDAIVSWTPEGVITAWNDGATRLLGYTEQEAAGEPISLIATEDHVPDALERYRSGDEEPPAPFETTLRAKDGRVLTVSVSLAPIKEETGGFAAISAIFRDVTALAHAREALRMEAQHKDDFLSQLSHELRNPLAPLRTCLDVLRADPQRREKESCLDIMDRQLGHLTALVDQLLDASRISSGKIQLLREPLDLATVVRQAVADLRAVIERAGLTLRTTLPKAALRIHGDRVRLTQVIANLLGNAAKFTDRGGVVQLTLERDASHARLTIRDNGIGIHPEALPRLFQPFAQAANLPQGTRTGLGLGLAVVRALVVSHGGTVEAASAGEGLGAEFVVRLPLSAPERRAVAAARKGR